MKKVILLAASIALVAPQAFAQAKNFEGFSFGANFESTNTNLDAVNGAAVGAGSGTTSGLGLQGRYDFALGNQFVLGVGLTYSAGNHVAAIASSTINDDVNVKDNTSIDFTPGFAVSDSMLVFGKISSLNAKLVGSTTSNNLSGVGYGIGLRAMLDKNMYFQAGYDSNKYGDVTTSATGATASTKSTVLSLGLGYKF